jgi:hypothetical protein
LTETGGQLGQRVTPQRAWVGRKALGTAPAPPEPSTIPDRQMFGQDPMRFDAFHGCLPL